MLQFSDNSFKLQTQGAAIKVLIKLIQLGYSTGYSRNIGTNLKKNTNKIPYSSSFEVNLEDWCCLSILH